jgi:hypothetical protein
MIVVRTTLNVLPEISRTSPPLLPEMKRVTRMRWPSPEMAMPRGRGPTSSCATTGSAVGKPLLLKVTAALILASLPVPSSVT